MAISKIKTGSITDSAVDTNKLAPGSVGSSDLSATVITGQTELSETAADTDFTIIYDTSAGTLKKILRSNLKQAGPTISSVSPTNANEGDATFTLTITGSGFGAGSNARLIDNNGKIQEFDTVTRNSTTQITATIATSNLNASVDPYDVQVTNGEGISSLLANQINFNANPTFVTSAGSLGSDRFSMSSVSVNATDPDSAGNVTFELQSGSLPPGISLVNTAADGGTATFSGTFSSLASSDTVYNFVLRAVDNASNTSSRSFSFTQQGPQYLSFTSSGTFAVPAGLTAVDVLVVGGGGGTAGSGGGGAGGLIFMPCYPVSTGTLTVTVGAGGYTNTGNPFHPEPGNCSGGHTGQDSVFGAPGDPGLGSSGGLTAKGGGAGGTTPTPATNRAGGSGGGAGKDQGPVGQSAPGIQPTQPDNSGAYGFGNPGGSQTASGWTAAAGGGGANSSGGNGSGPNPSGPSTMTDGGPGGAGGSGKSYTIADGTTPVTYAGGGGGAAAGTGGSPGPGGGGVGGNVFCSPSGAGSGQANKGGGVGGGAAPCQTGGKGIVIVKY
jgi:hypothetical protein